MAQFNEAWVEHQRRRVMRPDWQRWLRPDYEHYLRPGRRLDLQPETYDRKYSADQPRVPAGKPGGGQWTNEGGGGPGLDDPRVLSDATPDNDWNPGAQYAQDET